MLAVAYLIYLHYSTSDPKHEIIEKYVGFMSHDYGKVYFLLFCAMLVFPMDSGCKAGTGSCENNDWVNYLAGCVLSAVAIVNVMGVCRSRRKVRDQEKQDEKQK
jgi:hypothetical protein